MVLRFIREENGDWLGVGYFILASDGSPGDLFGNSVAASDSRVIVGASDNDRDMEVDAAAAYINETENSLIEEAILHASDAEGGDKFGFSVAISGYTTLKIG